MAELTLENFMEGLERRNPAEPEFYQAVQEVARDVLPFINDNPEYRDAQILERMKNKWQEWAKAYGVLPKSR